MHKETLIKLHQFVHKILSSNEILTTAKDRNYVVNLRKMTCNNTNLDLVKVNAYANLIKFHQLIHKILTGYEILTTTKGHNHVINL